MQAKPALTVVHSSDLHLCAQTGDDFSVLETVLETADRVEADLVLLAGDIFDHNRVRTSSIAKATWLLRGAGRQIVILPGNHDCLVPDSVYRRGDLAEPENVCVLGISADEAVRFPQWDLEVWGRPHIDYSDHSPLALPRARSTRWQIAMAHGHWVTGKHDLHRSYLIRDEEIAACTCDYIALGHWDRALQIGDGSVPAYYSGSPQLAGTVNVIRLDSGGVHVSREPLCESQGPERRVRE
ncbi:MAG TPA: metallophosphoesterase [Dehalococcoidia bacterium]|nr:metallophosphoesterase [Dehalococcoidia bacterium]